jgi:dTDP-glucose 4,6-dehydratase
VSGAGAADVTVHVVTGGAGFIGSHLVKRLLEEDPAAVVHVVDCLTYAGCLENLDPVRDDRRLRFHRVDVADARALEAALPPRADLVFHLAAESHVDRSLDGASAFARTNVLGTLAVLEWGASHGAPRHVQVSTDEVYGTLGPDDPPWTEGTPLAPRNPYAATKAAADLLALAHARSFGRDVVVTRCGNNYGPNQHPEKMVPTAILSALAGEPVPLYGDGLHARDWIHVRDHVEGLVAAARRGRAGEVYHLGGAGDRRNVDVAKEILAAAGRDATLLRSVPDRPGHDRRYALDARKAATDLGVRPTIPFGRGLAETVAWYRANGPWVAAARARAPALARGLAARP